LLKRNKSFGGCEHVGLGELRRLKKRTGGYLKKMLEKKGAEGKFWWVRGKGMGGGKKKNKKKKRGGVKREFVRKGKGGSAKEGQVVWGGGKKGAKVVVPARKKRQTQRGDNEVSRKREKGGVL